MASGILDCLRWICDAFEHVDDGFPTDYPSLQTIPDNTDRAHASVSHSRGGGGGGGSALCLAVPFRAAPKPLLCGPTGRLPSCPVRRGLSVLGGLALHRTAPHEATRHHSALCQGGSPLEAPPHCFPLKDPPPPVHCDPPTAVDQPPTAAGEAPTGLPVMHQPHLPSSVRQQPPMLNRNRRRLNAHCRC